MLDNSAPAIICAIFHQSSGPSLTRKQPPVADRLARRCQRVGGGRRGTDLTATGRPLKGYREDRGRRLSALGGVTLLKA
jgi:hypothetical protein